MSRKQRLMRSTSGEEGALIWRVGFFNEGSYWQEDLHVVSDEFEQIDAEEYVYDIPPDWDTLTKFEIPKRLSADCRKHYGVEKLSLRSAADPAVYLFRFACGEGIENNMNRVYRVN